MWQTPKHFFKTINAIIPIDMDMFAEKGNALVPLFPPNAWTEGLKTIKAHFAKFIWANPPFYMIAEAIKLMQKARKYVKMVVMLLPSCEQIHDVTAIQLWTGNLEYTNPYKKTSKKGCMFDSTLWVLPNMDKCTPGSETQQKVDELKKVYQKEPIEICMSCPTVSDPRCASTPSS